MEIIDKNMKLEDTDRCTCQHCGSTNAYGISRIVGYYSPIQNWNQGKLDEFKARQQGDYKL
jgi:ribonucleoside-triphosphate reductase